MQRSANLWLFLILSLNFWLSPLLPKEVASEIFTDRLLAFSLLAAIAIKGFTERQFRVPAICVACIVVAALAVEEIWPDTVYVENGAFAASFAAVTVFYFHSMTQTLNRVTLDTVFAAACAYILIGLFFASVFGLVIEHDPSAFAPIGDVSGFFDLLYYSFATLTTLGAADVLPVSDLARLLTVFEAMVGLIYIAILVGAVVGSFSAKLAGR